MMVVAHFADEFGGSGLHCLHGHRPRELLIRSMTSPDGVLIQVRDSAISTKPYAMWDAIVDRPLHALHGDAGFRFQTPIVSLALAPDVASRRRKMGRVRGPWRG
jgi:hypothetical protein